MDQVVAAVVEVEALGAGVGADEDHVLLAAEAGGTLAALAVVVVAGEREDVSSELALGVGSGQGVGDGGEAVGVLGVNQDVGARLGGPDGLDLVQERGDLGVVGLAGGGLLNQGAQLLFALLQTAEPGALALAGLLLAVDVVAEERELGRDILGLEGGLVQLLLVREGAETLEAAAQFFEGAEPLRARLLGLVAALRELVQAVGDRLQGSAAGADRGGRALEERHEREYVGVAARADRTTQRGDEQFGEFTVEGCGAALRGRRDRDRVDLALAEHALAGLGIEDVSLEPPDEVPPEGVAAQAAAAVDEAGVEQFDQRGEVRVVAVVGGGGQEDQRIGLAGQHLRQPAPARVLGVRGAAEAGAVVRLVDDDDVEVRAIELLQDGLLLGEVDRDQAQGDVIKGVGAELAAAADQLELVAVEDAEAQAETLAHLLLPLGNERASGRDDEDPVRATTGDELGEDQAGLDGLAEADVVRKQEPGARHLQDTQHGDELVGGDPQAPRLGCEQGRRPERLLEEEGVVVDAPFLKARGPPRVQLGGERLDGLEGGEDVEEVEIEAAFEAAQAVEPLFAGGLREDDLPAQTTCLDLGPGEKLVHWGLMVPGPRATRDRRSLRAMRGLS